MINLQALRIANNWTDKKAFEEAMKDGSSALEIYFPAGGGTAPGGAYDIWTDTWAVPGQVPAGGNLTRGDVTLYGDGYGTVIRQPDAGQVVFMAHPPQGNPGLVKSNITIRDLLLDGCLGRNPSYGEEVHLVRIAGVTNLTVQRVLFRNFMGDGLMLGSPLQSLVPRNRNLLVERCRFEATSTTDRGRNGISIHDCEGYTITTCSFENIGSNRPGFAPGPGAIDIEPVNSVAVVTGGRINNCSFLNVNRSAVALLNGVRATANNVKVEYCNVRNAGFGLFVIQDHDVVDIQHNYAENLSLQAGFMGHMSDSEHVNIQSNTFINGRYIRLENMLRWTMNGNGFRDCARGDGTLIFQNGNSYLGSILYNNLYNCGELGSAQNCIYYVQADGNAEVIYLNIKWNTVHSPSYIDKIGIVQDRYRPVPERNPKYHGVDTKDNNPSNLPDGDLISKP